MFQTLSLGIKPYAKVIHIGKSHKPTRKPKLAKEYDCPTHGGQSNCSKLTGKYLKTNKHLTGNI